MPAGKEYACVGGAKIGINQTSVWRINSILITPSKSETSWASR